MILINHPSLNNIASEYSKELYTKFEYKKHLIDKVLQNIENNAKCDFQPFSVNECFPAFKAIFNIEKLTKPSATKTTEILIDYITQVRKNIEGEATGKFDLNIIKKRLSSIFKYDLISLFSADINKIKERNTEFEKLVKSAKINKDLIEYFFDYTKYYEVINKYIGSELGVICCPYCNRNYITYVFSEQNGRIIGPTYDHFFNKKKYKYSSLSFFNLIPSCTICNSNLKHQINFDLKTHLYPYKDEFGENAVFDFNLSLIGSGYDNKIIFKPFIRIKEGICKKEKLKLIGRKQDPEGEVSGSIKVFKLQEIYETHHDTVQEVYDRFDANNKYYISSIIENLKKLGSGEEEFYRYHFRNYFEGSDFHKRPLAKLSRDIYDKMKTMLEDTSSMSVKFDGHGNEISAP